ncbi:NAD(P)-binding protein [Exidia glandulosa HHB12029]|uniref:NAD(P)-binding protein n=1 Tax=Exidia glandulosa HHB12029 TaxID=1314781 RepID=A0A165KL43_EXIGL|nr:NAD(P)-binding protein [Exidia glandulosa HHB12029]
MKAIIVDKDMHHKDLKVCSGDAPEPKVGKDDVLVDIYCSAVNFFDTLMPPHPFILGVEFAGRISKSSPIPQGCPFKPGDRVFGSASSAYAERAAAPWRNLHLVPANMTMEQAAGMSLTWPTSYEGIVGRGELKAGDWVLVHAGAGGVGLPAIQISKALGAKVIATAGSAAKLDVCKRLGGADHVIDYNDKSWPKQVLKLTGGHGVDVVYDPVGLIRESLKCIAWKGRAVVVGFTGGAIENLPLNVVLLKNVAVTGLHWGAYTKHEPERIAVVWKELFALVKENKVKPTVYEEIFEGLESTSAGIEAVTKRKTYGKAIVRLRKDTETAKL